MLRMRLMTASAAAALLMAPTAFAQDQTSTPPNVGEVPETQVNASSPRPNPGESDAPPAPSEPWTPETPGPEAVAYDQAEDEGWSEPDSAPPAGEAAMEASDEVEEAPMSPQPDPTPPADPMNPAVDPMEPPADTTIPPPPIDPAPDAAEDDLMDPEPPGA